MTSVLKIDGASSVVMWLSFFVLKKETLLISCMGTAPHRVCYGCRWFFQIAHDLLAHFCTFSVLWCPEPEVHDQF